MDDREYLYLTNQILRLIGLSLDNYKTQQMRRRLDGFIERSRASGVIPFCEMLEQDQGLLQKLRNFLTINVSEFFRDAEQFKFLRLTVLPELLRHKPELRIWSAGCSMGAEPYSIAMMLEDLSPGKRHRILAADLDWGSLVRARAGGPYPASEVRHVEKGLLLKYFTPANEEYRVVDRIMGRVEFKQHNLLEGTFQREFDLIVCRNVTIYFSEEAKAKLYRSFSASLKDNGVLFIGATETLLEAQQLGFQRLGPSFFRKGRVSAPLRGDGARTTFARN